MSGKPKALIHKWFSQVKKLGLSAEYGYHFKTNFDNEWQKHYPASEEEWMEKTYKIFLWFQSKTDGSEIEIKDNSLVWLYKECDPEFGEWQAKDCRKKLENELLNFPNIEIVHGKGFTEVKQKKFTKGELAIRIINEITKRKGDIDFIFCIGDDIGDEEIFKNVNSLYPKSNRATAGPPRKKSCFSFTCTVGRKPSKARYYVNDYRDTIEILKAMTKISTKVNCSSKHCSSLKVDPSRMYKRILTLHIELRFLKRRYCYNIHCLVAQTYLSFSPDIKTIFRRTCSADKRL